MARSGILCGGAWCIDRNLVVDHWPREETLASILTENEFGGCPGHNMATALKRLAAPFPVEAIGLLGDDADGRKLLAICDELGIERSALKTLAGATTCYTLVMIARETGKRSFFTSSGTHAVQTPDDFLFSSSVSRIVHLGLPGIHARLDAPWKDEESGWVAVLKKARKAGLKTNIELVSIAPERIRAVALPMLPWLDTLIINDHEAGAIAGIETVRDGIADAKACRAAAERLMELSSLELVAVHFPAGGVAISRTGGAVEHPSVAVPQSAIVSSNGAGDAFAAGTLMGHHEGWPLERSLRLAHASAASSLRSETTTGSIVSWQECLDLAHAWGWRQG
jgi:sugar/nucleoside kinase (ribokinase family)